MRADNPGAGGAIVLTGATDGVGRALARQLAAEGGDLILHGRSAEKGRELLAELRAATGNDQLSYERADFSSLDEIHALADRVARPTTGSTCWSTTPGWASSWPGGRATTGLELTFQVDYLSTYMLSCRLAPAAGPVGPGPHRQRLLRRAGADRLRRRACWSATGTACRPTARPSWPRSC